MLPQPEKPGVPASVQRCIPVARLLCVAGQVETLAYALQQVQNGMSVVLQLTPQHLGRQKSRLLALSRDETAAPSLRRAATTVAACWIGSIHRQCAPPQPDFYAASNPPRPQP